MTKSFMTRFITNTRMLIEVETLLSLSERENKALKHYSIRKWEDYKEINCILKGC